MSQFRRAQIVVALWAPTYLAGFGCVDVGERNVSTAEAAEGEGCNAFCEVLEQSDCENEECVVTCEGNATTCSEQMDAYAACARGKKLECFELANGRKGPPLAAAGCEDEYEALSDCSYRASVGIVASCAFSQAVSDSSAQRCEDLVQCCNDSPAQDDWFQMYGDCLCAPGLCADRCRDWCGGGDSDDDCLDCTQSYSDQCWNEADVRCAARVTCRGILNCHANPCYD